MSKLTRFDFWFLGLIFILNLALKAARLNSPSRTYFDEAAFYIPAARDYLQGAFDANFEHPPLAKLFMAAGVYLFGDNSWGWRIPEVLVGSLGVIFIYLLARKMFPPSTTRQRMGDKLVLADLREKLSERFVPILAAVFLTFEFSWFVNSRIATLEIYVASFSLAAAYFFWSFFKNESIKYLFLTGIFFGLAIASKWSGLFLLVVASLFYLWNRRKKLFIPLTRIGLIALIAAVIYLGSYSLYLTKHSLADLVNLQVRMTTFHRYGISERLEQMSPGVNRFNYQYAPWTWFFNPLYAYFGEEVPGSVKVIIFLYNPALFWGSLAAIALSLKKLALDKAKLFLVASFAAFWLPWFLAPRFSLPYYLIPALPFGILLLAKIIRERFAEKKFLLIGFMLAAAALFLFYYPLLANLPVPTWYLRILTGASKLEP